MIQLPTPITPPAPPTFNGVWLTSINISAYDPSQPVTANIVAVPYSSYTNTIQSSLSIGLTIPDVMALAQTDPNVAGVMEYLFAYVQEQVISGSIVFPTS